MEATGLSSCVVCKTNFYGTDCQACRPARLVRFLADRICRTNRCGHFVTHPKRGCDLHPITPCRIDTHLLRGGGCLADPPLFDRKPIPIVTKPTLTIDIPPIELPEPTSDLAVVTVAAGPDAEKLAELTTPPMEIYASMCGADFVCLREDHVPFWRLGNKFQVHQVAQRYKRTLYLDLDVLILSATDIFKTHSAGLWIHEDIGFSNEALAKALRQEVSEVAEKHFGGPIICDLIRLRNTGVVLCDQSTADVWKPPDGPIPMTTTGEQSFIEARIIRQFRARRLRWAWNCQHYFRDFDDLRKGANFLHFAGVTMRRKIELIREALCQTSTTL